MKLPSIFIFLAVLNSQSLTLQWEPSDDPSVTGYYLCYGTNSGNYTITNTLAGQVTNCTVNGLQPGQTYYFAVAAYSAYGLMSDFSNEVAYTNQVAIKISSPSVIDYIKHWRKIQWISMILTENTYLK